jgi:Zn-dependent M16 (insulinase) family peptidase
MAVVYGMPSAVMSKEISEKESERESQQAKDLGEDGLQSLQNKLDGAMSQNEQPIPNETLTSLPIPDVANVSSIPLFTAHLSPSSDSLNLDVVKESIRDVSTEDYEAIIAGLKKDSKLTSVPFHADLTHIDSAFVFAAVGIDTTSLTKEQRLYLPILQEILFKLPATLEDGTKLSKEEFVNSLQDETVSYSSGIGLLGGSISQMCYVSAQVENDDNGLGLVKALKWIRRALYLTNITTESVQSAVQRLVSDIPQSVRSGGAVLGTVASELKYDPEMANVLACNFLRQKPFLSKIVEGMESEDGSILHGVVAELERIRNTLFQTTNMHAFVAANLRGSNMIDTLVASLSREGVENVNAVGRRIENVSLSAVLRPIGASVSGGAVCALSAIESGFLSISAPGLKPYDANRASLLLAIEYLTTLEGPFWVKLRGAGLTYSYSISDSTDSQLLTFSLYKCGDIPAAFETASKIITEFASGNENVSTVGIENAKASLAYQIISGRSSKLSAATGSFVRTFKGEKMDYDKYLLACVANVTSSDIMAAIVTHLVPIFEPKSKLVVTCPTSKLDAVHDYFTTKGWSNLKKVPEEDLFTAFVSDI